MAFFEYRHSWSGYAQKSQAALRREEAAIEAFDAFRQAQTTPTTKMTAILLQPSHHLASPCYTTFAKHVRSFPGWRAKRREATPAEKIASKETRKGKVYFVSVSFDPVKAKDDIAKREASTASQAVETASVLTGLANATPAQPPSSAQDATTPASGRVTPEDTVPTHA